MRNILAPLFFLALCAPALAQDATLKAARGRVEIAASGAKKAVKARAGDELIFGDSLRTGKDGVAHVELADGAVILVKPGSSFTLAGYPEDAIADFSVGEFLIGLTKRLRAGGRFRARTPAAVAAVRGTLFWGRSGPDRKATFAALGHSVEVSAHGKTVMLLPGEACDTEYGFGPGAAASSGVKREFLRTFAVDGSIQGLDALADKKVK